MLACSFGEEYLEHHGPSLLAFYLNLSSEDPHPNVIFIIPCSHYYWLGGLPKGFLSLNNSFHFLLHNPYITTIYYLFPNIHIPNIPLALSPLFLKHVSAEGIP